MNTIDDQAILTDMLSSQKHITAQYNTFCLRMCRQRDKERDDEPAAR